jgi:hypothetical protein
MTQPVESHAHYVKMTKTARGGTIGWFAVCICGWHSPEARHHYAEADAEGDGHIIGFNV